MRLALAWQSAGYWSVLIVVCLLQRTERCAGHDAPALSRLPGKHPLPLFTDPDLTLIYGLGFGKGQFKSFSKPSLQVAPSLF